MTIDNPTPEVSTPDKVAGEISKRRRNRKRTRGATAERRIRGAVVDASKRREHALVELEPFDQWREGEPGRGPSVPSQMPMPARPNVPPREVVAIRSFLRPWRGEPSAAAPPPTQPVRETHR